MLNIAHGRQIERVLFSGMDFHFVDGWIYGIGGMVVLVCLLMWILHDEDEL